MRQSPPSKGVCLLAVLNFIFAQILILLLKSGAEKELVGEEKMLNKAKEQL